MLTILAGNEVRVLTIGPHWDSVHTFLSEYTEKNGQAALLVAS
jgi:hypothetical protein